MSPTSGRPTEEHLRLRGARQGDVAEIAAVLDAASRRWVGRATSAEQVQERLDTPNTDPEVDAVVVSDQQGRLVGFGHLWSAQPGELRCFARTHPVHTGLGVGTAMQEHLIARATEQADQRGTLPRPVLTTTSWPHDVAAEALLSRVGYGPARYFMRMIIELAGRELTLSPLPDGLTVRHVGRDDDVAIFDAFVESFGEHWGEEHPDRDLWWRTRRGTDSAGFDPGLWLVVLDGAELVGFAIAKVQIDAEGNEYGYVGDLGVRPGWRGRGIGQMLLSRSLDTFRLRGLPYGALDVDTENTTGAVRLYTKAGMEPRPSFTIWCRKLPPG